MVTSDRLACVQFVNLTLVCAGLSHQGANLKFAAQYARWRSSALIAPLFCLAGKHNHGKQLTSTLLPYYDLERLTVDGQRAPVLQGNNSCSSVHTVAAFENRIEVDQSWGMVYKVPRFVDAYKAARGRVRLLPSSRVTDLAQRASVKLQPGFVWIHVRRGDKLNKTANCTSAAHILWLLDRLLETEGPVRDVLGRTRNVYIAHNEPDYLGVYGPLLLARVRVRWHVYFYADLAELASLWEEDNFMLFAVEQNLGERASVRISTFSTGSSTYHASLCPQKGYQ